jgi:DNA polymerase
MPNASIQERLKQLEKIHSGVRRCRRCFLWKTRQHAVPGEGPLDSKVMFIGEAPGRKEDASGRPFVGFSGEFLDQSLEKVGLRREEVFITSSIKCIPVRTKKPEQESIDACNPWLQSQLELVRPRLICLLGAVASGVILGEKRISLIRGKIIERDPYLILATYHPASARRFARRREAFLKDFEILAATVRSLAS